MVGVVVGRQMEQRRKQMMRVPLLFPETAQLLFPETKKACPQEQ